MYDSQYLSFTDMVRSMIASGRLEHRRDLFGDWYIDLAPDVSIVVSIPKDTMTLKGISYDKLLEYTIPAVADWAADHSRRMQQLCDEWQWELELDDLGMSDMDDDYYYDSY